MPSQKKTVKSQKAQAPGAARGKTASKSSKSSASKTQRARTARSAKSASTRAPGRKAAEAPKAKVSRAATAKTAAKKTSAKTTRAISAASKPSLKRTAKAAAARTAAAKKTAASKSAAAKAKAVAAKSAAAKLAQAAKAKANAAKLAALKAASAKAASVKGKAKDAATPVRVSEMAKTKSAKTPQTQEIVKAGQNAAPQIKVEKKTEARVVAKPAITAVAAQTPPQKIAAPAAPRPTQTNEMSAVAKKATPDSSHRPIIGKAPAATPVAPNVVEPKPPVEASAAAKPLPILKPKLSSQKLGFKLNEFIVYPAHGVGQITAIEVQEVAGFSLELFVVSFIKDKMILKVPTSKVSSVGMRKLAESEIVDKALSTLTGRARIKRTMWSRRAQEYEAKINSGDLVTIAEVVRDLYRSDTQPEQSYSERQLYEAALDRMAREISAVRKLIDAEALKLIEAFLLKGPRRGPKNEGDAEEPDSDVVKAA